MYFNILIENYGLDYDCPDAKYQTTLPDDSGVTSLATH